jgi:hypothetical protein
MLNRKKPAPKQDEQPKISGGHMRINGCVTLLPFVNAAKYRTLDEFLEPTRAER